MYAADDVLTHPLTLVIVGCVLTAVLAWVGRSVGKVLDEQRHAREDLLGLRKDLVSHMQAEEAASVADRAERAARQEANDRRLGALEVAVDRMSEKVDESTGILHRRIDGALGALAAGNPEVRRS